MIITGKTLDFISPLALEVCKQRLEKDLNFNLYPEPKKWLGRIGILYKEIEVSEKDERKLEFRVICGFSKFNHIIGIHGYLEREEDKTRVYGASFVTKSYKIYHLLGVLLGCFLILLGLPNLNLIFLLLGVGFIFSTIRQYIYTTRKYLKILFDEIEEKLA